ncbi:MAG: ATP-grasp domain-containing protein [Bacteroidales bacterium]|nr:ATP-grasp domain-containing protein [Bacteroidales bacterium]
MKAVILINKISENALPDELDVLDQVEVVEMALSELGHKTERVFMDMNLENAEKQIISANPDFVFNLFEGITGKTDLIYLGAGLLNNLKIPYTGCLVDSIFITADKVLTKKLLKQNNIPTAKWFSSKEVDLLENGKIYILKPLSEDASLGITEKSVFTAPNNLLIEEYRKKYGNTFFIEEYIEGREFNISVMGTANEPVVLSPAEMIFTNFPDEKPQIVSYTAKWDEESFEYKNTIRTFDISDSDSGLISDIKKVVLKCWKVLNLRGYARIDLRVDSNNIPYVLEANANPCISADSGFYAAALKSGFTFKQVVKNIIDDALNF